MLNVALTGNIAAGKSAVVQLFRKWGATIIDADQLAREAEAPGTEVLAAIVRRTRLRLRGLSDEEADRMIAAQMPAERKRGRSRFVIDNAGTLEELQRAAKAVYRELRRLAKAQPSP